MPYKPRFHRFIYLRPKMLNVPNWLKKFLIIRAQIENTICWKKCNDFFVFSIATELESLDIFSFLYFFLAPNWTLPNFYYHFFSFHCFIFLLQIYLNYSSHFFLKKHTGRKMRFFNRDEIVFVLWNINKFFDHISTRILQRQWQKI